MSKTKKPKMPKRSPKAPKPNIAKTDKGDENPKKRSFTSPEIISESLMNYSAARASSDDAKFSVNLLKGDAETTPLHVTMATKRIRIGLKTIRSARQFISNNLRKNTWVKAMLEHLDTWEEQLDEAWEAAQDSIDE